MRIGLEVLRDEVPKELRSARVGLVAHPASVDRELRHATDVVAMIDDLELVSLFGPQHGVRGDKQDNMIESEPFRDPRTRLEVHSLYGEHRRPTAAMLAGLDALLFDLQDVGVRIYTYIWTMSLAMEACAEQGIRFVVLDRPNPIGGRRAGPTLTPGFESFVGRHPLPLQHGLTVGEIARLYAHERGLDLDLDVVECDGWRRSEWLDDTDRPYVAPSPNLPSLASCAVFPGTVLMEGTNLSEGRGTTRPFELVGAPYIEPYALAEALDRARLPGVHFRPCWFEPGFQKHAGQLCGGVQIHVLDRATFRPVRTGVSLLVAARELAPREFVWRVPPYEYEEVKPPIDILWGSDGLRRQIDAGAPADAILAATADELSEFEGRVRDRLLYR